MELDGLFPLTAPGGWHRSRPAAGSAGFARPAADSPLPVRMRPASLDELVGQEHLLAPGAPLRQLVTGATPDVGDPLGAAGHRQDHHRAPRGRRHRPQVRGHVGAVRRGQGRPRGDRHRPPGAPPGGPPTVLFIDEVHRFSKTQQDSLLAAVEDRTVTLLAATTENPYFSVISPLLSRCVLLTLHALDEDAVRALVRRAVTDERGLGGAVTLTAEAEDHLVRLAGGDVRKALTALEAAAASAPAQDVTEIDLATAEKAVDVAAVRYDRDGDAHYDVTSAFIKSMRGSDPDAALHWLARMLVAGEDPRFIARRIVIFASEDVGMADPQALLVATAAAQAVQNVGLPEAQLNLAQAVVHLATAPEVEQRHHGARRGDGRRPGRPRRRGSGRTCATRTIPARVVLVTARGYRYPHDDSRGVVTQQYVPDDLVGADYYQPSDHGAERAVGERLPRLRRIVRGLGGPVERSGGGGRSGREPPTGRVGGSVTFSAESALAESTVGSSAGDTSVALVVDGAVASPASPTSAGPASACGRSRGRFGGGVARTEVAEGRDRLGSR